MELRFYPANHLWFSFVGGICLAAVNVTWVTMAIHYSRQSQEPGRLVVRTSRSGFHAGK